VGDDWLTDGADVPGLHRRPFVRLREVGEDDVAGVDVGKVADDDLLLVSDGAAAEVPVHRIDRDVSGASQKLGGMLPVLAGVRWPGCEVHVGHTRGATRSGDRRLLGHADTAAARRVPVQAGPCKWVDVVQADSRVDARLDVAGVASVRRG
jgi:hypothetical protein